MTSRLLIGSVFANDSPQQQQWLDLQLKYLQATTPEFDHLAVVMTGTTNSYFADHTNVLVPENTTETASVAHLIGLQLLKQEFDKRVDSYDNFLFIDSDAFPIRMNWTNVLLRSMEPQDQFVNGTAISLGTTGRNYEIAVALRSENLETRLHASILFAKKQALPHLGFTDNVVGNDLLGNPEEDINLDVYQNQRRNFAMPLIRTNQYNVHPLACGIYYDMFYHHCCGSGRHFNVRSNSYFGRIIPSVQDLSHLTNQLMNSPNEFIHKLAGWNPSKYGSVEAIKCQTK